MAQIQLQHNRPIRKGRIIGGLIFAFAIILLGSLLLFFYPFASSQKSTYFQGENPILFNGQQAENAMIDDKSVYVPVAFMKEFVDENILFDEKSNSIIITTKDKVVRMPTDSLTYYVNEEPVQLHFTPLKDENGRLYIALDPILSYYQLEYSVLPETGAIWLKEDGEEIVHGKIAAEKAHEEKLRLRTMDSLQSPYTTQTVHNEPVYIEGKKGDYYYVRKEDGQAGFLYKKYVSIGETEKIVIKQGQKTAKLPELDGPIQLTWEAVYTHNPDTNRIPQMPGVNVVSPTWFKLADKDGAINNLGSLDYVKWANEQGYQVWALFSNDFDPDLTREAFADFETRQRMIRELLHYSQIYQLDGINIDIENVYPEDGPMITQFMREATPYFHEAGLIVSMDITFISGGNWSAFYERDKLASIVDYLIVMAYDEHWASSPVAGSVASLPWVEKNLQKLLEVVPSDKLVLGVPLYTRLWTITESGEVSSKSMSMENVEEWLNENQLQPIYDRETGQNYAELFVAEEGLTYKIWLEDELSLEKRAQLAREYNLAGVGSWSRYFADENAWTALNLLN